MTEPCDTASRELAAAVQQACLRTAQNAYEQARMDGLCHEGAWESAVSAMQRLDPAEIVRDVGERRSSE